MTSSPHKVAGRSTRARGFSGLASSYWETPRLASGGTFDASGTSTNRTLPFGSKFAGFAIGMTESGVMRVDASVI
jgi:hypothetical protein